MGAKYFILEVATRHNTGAIDTTGAPEHRYQWRHGLAPGASHLACRQIEPTGIVCGIGAIIAPVIKLPTGAGSGRVGVKIIVNNEVFGAIVRYRH
jgi:hypothetical protein